MKNVPKHQVAKQHKKLVQVEVFNRQNPAQRQGQNSKSRWLNSDLEAKNLLLLPTKDIQHNATNIQGTIFALVDQQGTVQEQDLVAYWLHNMPQIGRLTLASGRAILSPEGSADLPVVVNSSDLQLLGKVLGFYVDSSDHKALCAIDRTQETQG